MIRLKRIRKYKAQKIIKYSWTRCSHKEEIYLQENYIYKGQIYEI